MRRVGVREFADRAAILLDSGEPLVVERDGKPIGIYRPVAMPLATKDRAAGLAALDRLGETVEAILARTGMTEDELVAALTGDDAG